VVGLNQLGGWGELMEITSAVETAHGDSMTSLIRSHKDPDFPWTGVILGSAIIGFWYWCTDQYIVQRVLSGRNQKQSRKGTIFGAYLKLLPVFIFLVPGMIAFALHQKGMLELSSPDAAFSALVSNLLPVGLKGIVIGGLIAALMSSLASLFNSSAMLFTVDFYQKWRPDSTEKHLTNVGRMATVVIVFLGILWIPVMQGMGQVLYEYLQDVQSLLAPGIASVFLIGIMWKRATPAAGFSGLLTGFVLGMSRLVAKVFSGSLDPNGFIYNVLLAPNWLHFSIYLFLICIVVIVAVSLVTKPLPVAQTNGLTIGTASVEEKAETRASWDGWDVFNTLVIIAITVGFYIYFW